MKIAVIHSIYKPYVRGGAEVVVQTVVDGLKARGEDVFVVSVGYENKMEIIDGVKVYRIKPFNLFNFLDINSKPAWLRLPWHIIDMFNDMQGLRINKVLTQEKPDVVFTHNLKGLGYYAPWLIRFLKIKNIHTVHDAQLLHPSGLVSQNGKLGFIPSIYAWWCKKLFRSPKVVIFPSHYIQSLYDQHNFFPKSQKVVLGNPIVIPSPSVIPAPIPFVIPTEVEGSLTSSVTRNVFTFLYLGQVEEYKGILELIETVKLMKDDCRLIVVGDGAALERAKLLAGSTAVIPVTTPLSSRATSRDPLPAFLPSVISAPALARINSGGIQEELEFSGSPIRSGMTNNERIIFYGRCKDQQELDEKIWPQVDVLVNPSKVPESFGMVVIEAQAHGVPVLASKNGGLPELIEEGKTGWLFSSPSSLIRGRLGGGELSEKLRWCLKNRDSIKSMREDCIMAAKRYDAKSYIDKILEYGK